MVGILSFINSNAEAREQIRIVGSSTVYPFATAVAEEFGKITSFKTPVIESTGSGGGLKLFCAGVGTNYPDITNSSRRIKESEVKSCRKNGVEEILEVKIGFDGIVISNSRNSDPVSLTLQQLFLALAKEVPDVYGDLVANSYEKWSDIDGSLPETKIEVLGPPPTSGTRDAFIELAMEGGCKTFPEIKVIKSKDKNTYKKICHTIREDGAYVEAGENDNLIIKKLESNPKAFGIFGYGFLEQNKDLVQGALINNVEPTFELIAKGDYPISRSLYFYVKKAHIGIIPGLEEYLDQFTAEETIGEYGYLTDKGLIPLADSERITIRNNVLLGTPLEF